MARRKFNLGTTHIDPYTYYLSVGFQEQQSQGAELARESPRVNRATA